MRVTDFIYKVKYLMGFCTPIVVLSSNVVYIELY